MPTLGALIVVTRFATGGAERYVIRSYPNDVRVSVNEEVIGVTPVVVSIPRGQLRDAYRWLAEKDGHESQEAEGSAAG